MKLTPLFLLAAIIFCIVLYATVELLIIKYNGQVVPAPNIPRTTQMFRIGPKLTYIVMGDSTTIGQGAAYEHSYTIASAQHLAKKYSVSLINVGMSGARAENVLHDQLPKVVAKKPDVVLIGVGANDTTHFTNLMDLQSSLQKTIDGLQQANPDVRIVMTRSPALDSVSRFPWLSKQLLRHRTAKVNEVFDSVIKKNDLTPALIAEKTRDAFLADPSLTSVDKFHPNERGYSLWVPIVNEALDAALRR